MPSVAQSLIIKHICSLNVFIVAKLLMFKLGLRQLNYWLSALAVLPLLPWLIQKGRKLRQQLGPVQPAAGSSFGVIPASGISSANPFRVLIFGDSLVEGVGAPTLSEALAGQVGQALQQRINQPVHWAACGRSGYTSHDIVYKLFPLLPADETFDAIVISVGVNDCTHAVSPWQWHRNMGTLFTQLEQQFGTIPIVLLGIPPLALFPAFSPPLSTILGKMAHLLNATTAEMIRHFPQVKLPFFTLPESLEGFFAADGVHPGPKGYQLIASGVAACFPAFEEGNTASA